MKRIVFMSDEGTLCQIIPARNCPMTLIEIAEKDVPTGNPFWLVDESIIPERNERNEWVADLGPAHGVGA